MSNSLIELSKAPFDRSLVRGRSGASADSNGGSGGGGVANSLKFLGGSVGGSSGSSIAKSLKSWRRSAEAECNRYFVSISRRPSGRAAAYWLRLGLVSGNGLEIEMSADRYGRYYWCVKTSLSPNGEIYLHADDLSIRDGCLIFTGGDSAMNMTFGPGQWKAAFAASCIDGHAVAVEHWPGEVVR